MTEGPPVGRETTTLPRRADALWSAIATLLVILLVAGLLRLLGDQIISTNAGGWPFNPAVTRIAGTTLTRFVEVGAVLLALAVLFRLTGRGSFNELGLHRRGAKWLPVGAFLPMLALLLAAVIAYAAGLLPVNRVLYPGLWPTFLVLAAATQAAWVEEIAFRGVLMQGIESLSNRTIAILASAALFTLLHLLAPFELSIAWWIVVAAGGLGLGWAFYASQRSLWLTIGLHWGLNVGVFLLLGLPGETRGWLQWAGSGQGAALSSEAGAVMLIGLMLTGVALFWLLGMAGKRRAEQ